jgi:hypothetical protein
MLPMQGGASFEGINQTVTYHHADRIFNLRTTVFSMAMIAKHHDWHFLNKSI